MSSGIIIDLMLLLCYTVMFSLLMARLNANQLVVAFALFFILQQMTVQ